MNMSASVRAERRERGGKKGVWPRWGVFNTYQQGRSIMEKGSQETKETNKKLLIHGLYHRGENVPLVVLVLILCIAAWLIILFVVWVSVTNFHHTHRHTPPPRTRLHVDDTRKSSSPLRPIAIHF